MDPQRQRRRKGLVARLQWQPAVASILDHHQRVSLPGSREDRPRPYLGPDNPNTGRPFPDTGMDFVHGYRFGMPFFIPVEYYDTRIQVLDNISVAKGDHLIKAGVEWNRSNPCRPSSALPMAATSSVR